VTVPQSTAPPNTIPSSSFWKLAGPGLVVAATGIGSGDVVSATVGGARYGVVLLWAIALGAFFKFVLSEGIARWQLATGQTIIEGWAEHLHASVKIVFGIYLVLWTVAVSAALTNACGLGLTNLTGGAVPQSWGAVAHSLIGFAFVWLGGYGKFEKLMKLLVGLMGFSILVCAALTMRDPAAAVMQGLVLPIIRVALWLTGGFATTDFVSALNISGGGGLYVLSLIGGIGGSVTMLSYNYWMREEGMRGSGWLSYVRGDVAVAYVFTAIFGMSIMLIANTAFFVPGVALRDAEAVPRMAAFLGTVLGPFGVWAYGLGFWAAVFASLLGVWQSVPYLYADIYGVLKGVPVEAREAITKVTSRPYQLGLVFISLVPLPLAFTGAPLLVIVTYTVIGSLFVPFLAGTLLYLNNKVAWADSAVPKNAIPTNLLLIVILVLFVFVGGQEAMSALRRIMG
jgi:Mn2+/Fe2+ NRAMP family transporter